MPPNQALPTFGRSSVRAPIRLLVRHRMATGVEVSPEKIDTDVIGSQDGSSMKPKVPNFSFKERAAEKAAARAR